MQSNLYIIRYYTYFNLLFYVKYITLSVCKEVYKVTLNYVDLRSQILSSDVENVRNRVSLVHICLHSNIYVNTDYTVYI